MLRSAAQLVVIFKHSYCVGHQVINRTGPAHDIDQDSSLIVFNECLFLMCPSVKQLLKFVFRSSVTTFKFF